MSASEATTRIDGRRVTYHEEGTGPVVVVVHGLGLSGRFWRPHFPALRDAGLRVVAPDLPGFGRSETGRWSGQTVEETADWLLAFADRLGLDQPAWLGHSIGAQATLDLAARWPRRATALVLVTPTGMPGRARRTRQAWSFARDVVREPKTQIVPVLRDYLRASTPAFLGTWWKAGRDHPLEKTTGVACPTLLVAGRDDPVVPRRFLHALETTIPTARTAVLPDGAHGVFFDHPAIFDRVVASFLREAMLS